MTMEVTPHNSFPDPAGLTNCNRTSFDEVTKIIMTLVNQVLRSPCVEALATFSLKSLLPRGLVLVIWETF